VIHKTDAGYVISAHRVWRPGVYDSERAARYAFRFTDEVLQRAQDSAEGGVITYEMLRKLKDGE
jgi:hypothetical protein